MTHYSKALLQRFSFENQPVGIYHWSIEKKPTSKSDRLLIVSNNKQIPNLPSFTDATSQIQLALSTPSKLERNLLRVILLPPFSATQSRGQEALGVRKNLEKWLRHQYKRKTQISNKVLPLSISLFISHCTQEVILNLLTWFLSLICSNRTLFTAITPRKIFQETCIWRLAVAFNFKIKIEKWRMKAFVAWCTKLYAQLKWSYELMIKREGIYCNEPPTHSTIECLGGTRESLDLPRHDTSRVPLHLKVTKRSRVASFKKFRFLFNMRTFYRWIK